MTLPDKKRYSLLAALIAAILITVLIIMPGVRLLNDYIRLYRPVLSKDIPTIILKDNGLELKGELPKTVTLKNGVKVFFDRKPDKDRFLSVPQHSVFIAEKELWIQRKSDVKKIDLENLNSDDGPQELNPVEIGEAIDKYARAFIIGLTIASIILSFLINWLFVLFGGGIGLMVDAFGNGHLNYWQITSLAGGIYVLLSIVMVVLPGVNPVMGLYLFGGYLLLTVILVVLINKRMKISSPYP